MTFFTLRHVHTSPRNPYVSAPWESKSGIIRFWLSTNSAGRPGGESSCRLCSPWALAFRNHWLTVPLLTFSAIAISDCFQPLFFSFKAWKRRCSFQFLLPVLLLDMQQF